jgi:hypothetical protein
MGLLAAIWENVYGLLVDDGSIALGTLLALVVVGGWTWLTSPQPELHDFGGLLLFVLLMGLLVANLFRTGRAAARRLSSDQL